MKEHPILFSGPMVRAILDGRKTQTRRVINPQPKVVHDFYPDGTLLTERLFRNGGRIRCPYGVRGDRLWVRETWGEGFTYAGEYPVVMYRADGKSLIKSSAKGLIEDKFYCGRPPDDMHWKPSIHMPRWASRITLEVVDLHVQPIQTISKQDAIAEGVSEWEDDPKGAFRALWDSINADRAPWGSNPWVWAVAFRRIYTNPSAEPAEKGE